MAVAEFFTNTPTGNRSSTASNHAQPHPPSHFSKEQLDSISQSFEQDGVFILRNAISADRADALKQELKIINEHSSYVGNYKGKTVRPTVENQANKKFRFKDLYINSAIARNIVFEPVIIDALTHLLDKPVIAFMNQGFCRGSGLSLHRDTNFMDFAQPGDLIACWIALEDIQPGSGELIYYPGSHRIPTYYFHEDKHRWNKQRDGVYAPARYRQWLENEMDRLGLTEQRFLANKGDCIIWHGELAHAGSEITIPDSSRYCLTTHFCTHDNLPLYLNLSDKLSIAKHNESCYFSSRHYHLDSIKDSSELEGETIKPHHIDISDDTHH